MTIQIAGEITAAVCIVGLLAEPIINDLLSLVQQVRLDRTAASIQRGMDTDDAQFEMDTDDAQFEIDRYEFERFDSEHARETQRASVGLKAVGN